MLILALIPMLAALLSLMIKAMWRSFAVTSNNVLDQVLKRFGVQLRP